MKTTIYECYNCTHTFTEPKLSTYEPIVDICPSCNSNHINEILNNELLEARIASLEKNITAIKILLDKMDISQSSKRAEYMIIAYFWAIIQTDKDPIYVQAFVRGLQPKKLNQILITLKSLLNKH